MKPTDIDMNAIAAPILARWNAARAPEDTWEYTAEHLDDHTFAVNAEGRCLTHECFERRDELVESLADEIAGAANAAARIDSESDEAWCNSEIAYWDAADGEIENPDDTDENDDPLWRLAVVSQRMVCCYI